MFKEEINRNNSPNSELAESGYTGLVLKIKFLEEGGGVTCGASVADGRRFFTLSMDECNSEFHTQSKGLGEDLPGGKGGAWLVMAPSDPNITSSTFFQPEFSVATDSKVNNFEVQPISTYTLLR